MYKENIFTKIIKKEVPAEILFENEFVLVINDVAPRAKIHWLVLPKGNYTDLKHFLNEAPKEDQDAYYICIKEQLNKLNFANVQFNVGEGAGQEVMHLHAHITSDGFFTQ